MTQDVNQIKTVLNEQHNFLETTFQVKRMGIFGSVARGDNRSTSDIDLLVEFTEPIGMFKFIDLEEYLSQIIGGKVDLVTKNALKPSLKEEILRETVYV